MGCIHAAFRSALHESESFAFKSDTKGLPTCGGLLEQHPFHNYFFRVFDDVVVVALVVIVKSNIPTEKNRSAFDKGRARARRAGYQKNTFNFIIEIIVLRAPIYFSFECTSVLQYYMNPVGHSATLQLISLKLRLVGVARWAYSLRQRFICIHQSHWWGNYTPYLIDDSCGVRVWHAAVVATSWDREPSGWMKR